MSGVSFLEKLLDGEAVEWKELGDVIRLEKGRQLRNLFTEEVRQQI